MSKYTRRCAIYTRKSSEEGLEQDFNSLQAQREACEAYIKSQQHEGWQLVKTAYDDGGISGGTMERPALQRLLSDIQSGKIDIIVVYKVDRLTRSLADFARLVEIFDKHGVSFVAVTQQFNTTSSMGRLTLNVLLSFAQFEREVTGERIRDKIAASKKKGLWMGGFVPFGYEARERTLTVNETEAEIVREIYRLYQQHGNVRIVKAEVDQRGYATKTRPGSGDRLRGSRPFSRGHLYRILSNPIYAGKIAHKGEIHPGQHPAIIDEPVWHEIQTQLKANAAKPRGRKSTQNISLLGGLLFDDTGERLTPSHANKKGKRYRYYVSNNLIKKAGSDEKHGWRIAAQELEKAVLNLLISSLKQPLQLMDKIGAELTATQTETVLSKSKNLAQELAGSVPDCQAEILKQLLHRIVLTEETLTIEFKVSALLEYLSIKQITAVSPVSINASLQIRKRGIETKLVIPGGSSDASRTPDATLIKAIARAHAWWEEMVSGTPSPIESIARRENISPRYVSRLIQLAFLSPAITTAILNGHQPVDLTLEKLSRTEIPPFWKQQKEMLIPAA
ncbi:MAG: recombinase family protein [Pseudomonadota bacterium]|nr:recombinase family protein [Pseudomonadota bacterium]